MTRHPLHDPTFSHFSRTPTCDRQTGRHTTMAYAYTVLAWRCAVKTVRCATVVPWYHPTLHFTTIWALSPSCPPVGWFRVVCAGSAWRIISHVLLGRPFVKRFALRYRTVVCLSCLSVTFVYCGQTVRWIKMKLGVEVGLGLRPHFVRWGPSIPSRKGAQPPIFGPCLSWPNGWMDQDATWYGGRPWPKPHYVRWGPSSLPKKERSSPLFGRCLLWPYGRPSHLFNRGYRPITRMRKVSSFSAELNHLNTLSNIKRAFAYL